MPRPGPRLLGILAACALAACGPAPVPPAPAPTPPVTPPPATSARLAWSQNLTLSGEVRGRIVTIAPNQPGQVSECTGRNSKTGGAWASTINGLLGQDVYGIVFSAQPYRGPGSYSEAVAKVQVHTVDNKKVWQSQPGDPVTLTVANDEESGTVQATLTNLADGTTKLTLSGSWSCVT
ncbi:MAG TPA: hypothetical protein VF134_05715 [Candidatus Dormibacteraeota bacterium]